VTKLIVAFGNFANVPKELLETAFKEGVGHDQQHGSVDETTVESALLSS
jgi:hypothetical protein